MCRKCKFLFSHSETDKNINTWSMYHFGKMNSLWHNAVMAIGISCSLQRYCWYLGKAGSHPHSKNWKWFKLLLWGEGANFWLLNFPDNLWIIVVIVKASVRNRSLGFLSWGLVLMDVEAPKGWWRQGLSKHVSGHRFWKLSTTVPPAVLHFRIHSHH